MAIHPYAVLAESPETEVCIAWIDDDGDGSSQTLTYDNGSVSSTGEAVPEATSTYKYEVEITGLTPDTEYSGTIAGTENVTWRTLPDTLSDGVRLAAISDIHIDYSMEDPADMQHVGEQDPDIVLFVGDCVTGGYDVTTENTTEWLRFFSDYVPNMNDGRLRPMFWTPGNHEVGPNTWDGSPSGVSSPNAGYFQFWFSTPDELSPSGENYGSVTVGGGLQLLSAAVYSAEIGTVATWLDGEIDDTATWAIPFYHAPLLRGTDYVDDHITHQELVRDEFAPILSDAENVHATFCGHMHSDKRTVPWSVVDSQPSGDEYLDLENGYLVGDSGGVAEFGDGWTSSFDLIDEWYLARAVHVTNFYTVDVTDDAMTVTDRSLNGSPMSIREFDENGVVVTEGRTRLQDATIRNAQF